MTKTRLIKWLECEMAKALEDVEENQKQAFNIHTQNLYEIIGLDDIAEKLYKLINEADDLLKHWKNEHKDKIQYDGGWYGSLQRTLSRLVNSPDTIKNTMVELDFYDASKKKEKIESKFKEMALEVKRNYHVVVANVKQLKNAKLAIEYLQELGFDLTELLKEENEPLTTALSTEINTKFLFINQK